MPCFYCGKRVSLVRQLTDADFCSDEHRKKYHELTRMALSRLVESHEQVTAPPRRKGKGHAGGPRETAPIPESLEPQAPEAAGQPASRRGTAHTREEPAPAPEKRAARPHRQPAHFSAPPAPAPQPDPAIAGFAALPLASFSAESTVRFAEGGEKWPSEVEIGDLTAGSSPVSPWEGAFQRHLGAVPAAVKRPARARARHMKPAPFAAPDTLLPRFNLSPVFEELASLAPEPAGWLAERPQPSHAPAFLLVEPTPARGPRPVIPRTASESIASLPRAELIPAGPPVAAESMRAATRGAPRASSIGFRMAPVMPGRADRQARKSGGLQDPPAATLAPLPPPAAVCGSHAVRRVTAAPGREPAIYLPRRAGVAARSGIRIEDSGFVLPAPPGPAVGERKPLTGLEYSDTAGAGPLVPMLPGLPPRARAGQFDACGFQHSAPMPAANPPTQSALSASGRAAVRPMALPRAGWLLERRGLPAGESPMEAAVPQAKGARTAPRAAAAPMSIPAALLPVAGRMALATGLAASEPVPRRPLPSAGLLPPATAYGVAAPPTSSLQLAVLGPIAVWKPAAPASGIAALAMPAVRTGVPRPASSPHEEVAGVQVRLPGLTGKPLAHEVLLTSFVGWGMIPVSGKAIPASSVAPLALPPDVFAGDIPILLPAATPAVTATHLRSAAVIPGGASPAALSGEQKLADWAGFPFDPARALAHVAAIAAVRALPSGALHLPGAPVAKAPASSRPSRAEAAFTIPETRRPLAPAKFYRRIPDTMPPVAMAPPQFAGTIQTPLGATAGVPGREPGLPAIEFTIPAFLSLRQQDVQPPGTAKAPVSTATPIQMSVPLRIEAIHLPQVPGRAQVLTIAAGDFVPCAGSAAWRDCAKRPGAAVRMEFPVALASLRMESRQRGAACELAGAGAMSLAGRSQTGANRPSAPESAGIRPAPAQLPGPQSVPASLTLSEATWQSVEAGMLAGTLPRRSAEWESVVRDGGTPAFRSLSSKFAVDIGATIGGGRLQGEDAPAPLAGTLKRAPAASVEVLARVALPESTGFAVSLRPVPVCQLAVRPLEDDRTGVKMVRLAPLFRPVRRPARLPVFGPLGIEKAGMPDGLWVPLEGLEDLDDYGTMRLAAPAGACPVRTVMPVSKRLTGIRGTLASADLIHPAPRLVDRTPRTSAIDYKAVTIRPQLPDGWVDTIPAEFNASDVEAARSQNWEPLVGAVRSASRFFKFMCLALLLWTGAGNPASQGPGAPALLAEAELGCDGCTAPTDGNTWLGATIGRGRVGLLGGAREDRSRTRQTRSRTGLVSGAALSATYRSMLEITPRCYGGVSALPAGGERPS